ncbi:hypothetical protein C8R44DRAFT_68908 [Mycena epipterygia]|nr:hypothetical protein C8R44DRAFT_68908 [Mycena epipterygia]
MRLLIPPYLNLPFHLPTLTTSTPECSWTASLSAALGSPSPPTGCSTRTKSSRRHTPPRPVLLLIGTKLGTDGVNPVYYETIKHLYTFPRLGGRPSSSYYFIGVQGNMLFYLDPHHARPAVPLEPFTGEATNSTHAGAHSTHATHDGRRSLSPDVPRGSSMSPDAYAREGSLSPDFAHGGSLSPDFARGASVSPDFVRAGSMSPDFWSRTGAYDGGRIHLRLGQERRRRYFYHDQ